MRETGRGRLAAAVAVAAIGCMGAATGAQAAGVTYHEAGHATLSGSGISAWVDRSSNVPASGATTWQFNVSASCRNGAPGGFGAHSNYTTGSASVSDGGATLSVSGQARFCGDVVPQPYHFRATMRGDTVCDDGDIDTPDLRTAPVGVVYSEYTCDTGVGDATFDFYSANAGGWHYNDYLGGTRIETWHYADVSS